MDHDYKPILSVSEAEQRLMHWDSSEDSLQDLPNFIAIAICDEEGKKLAGTANEYHNLASEFARNDLYDHAKRVAIAGAAKYKYNVDLLADIVKFGSQSQDWTSCQRAYDRLMEIDNKKWTWRTFTFIIDYLLDKMETGSECDTQKTYSSIVSHIAAYKELNDERAWVAEASLLIAQGERAKAISSLKKGVKKVAVAPQCCVKLADLLLEDGNYKEVIHYAAIGVKGTAQEQPSASNGYLFYVSALAKDALIHQEEMEKDKEEDTEKGFSNINALKDALLDYEIAYQLLEGRRTYIRNIQQRMTILKSKSSGVFNIDEDTDKEELANSLLLKLLEHAENLHEDGKIE